MCDNKKERAVIVFTVTQQKIKLETVQKKLPEEEAKKMKCCKRLIYKQSFPSLRSLYPIVSELFAETFHAPL